MSLSDLKVGTVVRGTVQNVVDFGAFVDFGIKTPGLVHRSQLSSHPFRHPTDIVHTGASSMPKSSVSMPTAAASDCR